MRFKLLGRKGRNFLIYFFFSLRAYLHMILSNLSLPRLSGCLHVIFPALICGCSEEIPPQELLSTMLTKASLNSSAIPRESTLDIFTFEDDRQSHLDAYQRFENIGTGAIGISSTSGEKIFFFCVNGQKSKYDWGMISSYYSLKDIYCDLEKETHAKRTMTGEIRAKAGNPGKYAVVYPLSNEVVIEVLGCDFSGTPYSNSVITDLKVYLINVSASCPLLYSDIYRPNRIINTGCLNPADIKLFRDHDIITRDITKRLGKETIYPDINLLCYPNPSTEETLGSPHTRLVIEGNIDSQTYYWPVTINKGDGIGRGNRYVYDILIRRKGVTDPDTPIDDASMDIKLKIKPWTEKEEYSVDF